MMSIHRKTSVKIWVVTLLWISSCYMVKSQCKKGCSLALASYYVWSGANITFIAQMLDSTDDIILSYNPVVPDKDRVQSFTRVNVPFSCDCVNGSFLGHIFSYRVIKGDTYSMIAQTYYANLTSVSLLESFNSYAPNDIQLNSVVNVPVNCSCGDSKISKDYGLFLTYPLRPDENLTYVDQLTNSTPSVLQEYNPNVNIRAGSGILFIPAKDKNGEYPPFPSSTGLSGGAIAGITVAVVVSLIMVAVTYLIRRRRKNMKKASLLIEMPGEQSKHTTHGSSRTTTSATGTMGVTVDKSVEFSYEELAQATDNFSLANKIGSGGFGDVFYAELRGEKAAVKKMDMQASKEFLAELKVLTRVHHLNLVRLIGYCVEECLFLVYEFIENGNLSQHLRGSAKDPLTWHSRVQIALDSARGLEYIHEHTVPVYIHRDIKSANILIDKNCHAKVADFGLTKLTEVGNFSAPTRLVGTFGYMPPEYAQYGEVTPKVDVYAFGVVLYELISAKPAVVKENALVADSKGLVGMFEAVLNQHTPSEIQKLVDPRLGNDYPLNSVYKHDSTSFARQPEHIRADPFQIRLSSLDLKRQDLVGRMMAQLAFACTQESPHLRPSMRSVVVALMTMSSTTAEWDVNAFYEDQGLVKLMSAR